MSLLERTTLDDGTDEYTPILIDGYSAAAESGNIVHALLNGGVAVTLRDGQEPAGRLRALWPTSAAAAAHVAALREPVIWTLADLDHSALAMSFVVVGQPTLEIDDETRSEWWAVFEYQEITP